MGIASRPDPEGECFNEEECGGEEKAPDAEGKFLGFNIDVRPFLPLALSGSTTASFACLAVVQIPFFCHRLGQNRLYVSLAFGLLYGLTLGVMLYAAFTDPGQISKKRALRI